MWDADIYCIDALNETTIGFVSVSLLFYSWSVATQRWYFLVMSIPYFIKIFQGTIYSFNYCISRKDTIAIPWRPTYD